MTEVKNKGGRPTNAELAARGITKTELEAGLKILKKYFGPAITRAIEIANIQDLPLDKQFKMQLDLIKLYMEMQRANVAMKKEADAGNGAEDEIDKPMAPVFKLTQ